MVCDVAEIAAGVPLAWARRDGAGVSVAAMVPGVAVVSVAAVVASALSVLTALVPVDVGVLSSTVSAAACVLVPFQPCPRRCSLRRLATAARLLPEAGRLLQWPPWASSR